MLKEIIFKGLCVLFMVLLMGALSWSLSQLSPDKEVVLECDTKGSSQAQILCWENLLRARVEQVGLGAGFELFKELYAHSPVFVQNCHGLMHTLGESAHSQIKNGKNITYSETMTECGYGFFHGYIEALLKESNYNYEYASSFCESFAASQQTTPTKTVLNDCFHGIGHGVVSDYDSVKDIKVLEEVVAAAIELCEDTATKPEYATFCFDGAFHSASVILREDNSKALINDQDLLALCKKQPEKYQTSCYGAMSSFIFDYFERDLVKSVSYLVKDFSSTSNELPQLKNMVRTMANYQTYTLLMSTTLETFVQQCRSIPSELFLDCVRGRVDGLMDFGEPSKAEHQALALCSVSDLKEAEQLECGQHVITRTGDYFGQSRQKAVCQTAPSLFQAFCPQE